MPRKRPRQRAFTLVEIMIVVLIIGILLGIAVPNFITARQKSRLQTIVANLREIDDAKEHCAMVNALAVGDSCSDYTPYIKNYPPKFPITGTLAENAVGTYATFAGKNAQQWTSNPSGL